MNELSQRRLEANRKNAKLGGVKTAAGKGITRFNSLKHGLLLSKEILLEDEDENLFLALKEQLISELTPFGALELLLVERIIVNFWRIKRALNIEKGLMEYEKLWVEKTTHEEDALAGIFTTPSFDKQILLDKSRVIKSAIANESIEKIIRYETTVERQIYRALHEFLRLKAFKKGDNVQIPLALDINISGDNKNDGFVSQNCL